MSTTVPSPGLFVEAAYGPEGLPGQGGITGGGEAHDVAWKAALADAKAQFPAAVDGCQLVPEVSPQVQTIPVLPQAVPGMAQDEVKAVHPLSWDRLSMTVASMVAWNMQVDVAEDVIATADDLSIPEGLPQIDGPLQPSGEFELHQDSADFINQQGIKSVQPSVAVGQAKAITAEQNIDEPAGSALEASSETNMLDAIIEPNTGLDPAVLREGSDSAQRLDLNQEAPTDFLNHVVPENHVVETLGTVLPSAEASIQQAQGSVSDSEIPTSPTQSSGKPAVTGNTQQMSQSAAPKVSSVGDIPHQDIILRVNDSSAPSPAVQAGLARLEAIRAALTELDTQAAMRAQVAAFHEASTTPDTSTVSLSAVASKTVAADAQPGMAQPIQGHKARADSPVQSQPDAMDEAGDSGQLPRDGQPRPPLAQELDPRAEATRPGTTQRMKVQAPQVQTSADFAAAQMGSENAEISADQETMTQTAKVDAEHIEAGEVPELPVMDASHLDIDIDDPAGTVRVSMTKEAEEVAIKMETPQQVLEEYREMESDLEKAMAMQGLNLADFDATGQDPDQDSGTDDGSTPGDKESQSDGLDTGVQDLEQTGATARLVNRIV
jgi:hypothetical protein